MEYLYSVLLEICIGLYSETDVFIRREYNRYPYEFATWFCGSEDDIACAKQKFREASDCCLDEDVSAKVRRCWDFNQSFAVQKTHLFPGHLLVFVCRIVKRGWTHIAK